MITTPGYYPKIEMADYIADPCPAPSLSTAVVCDLDKRTPLRAWTFHPRLGKRHSPSTARGELGSAVHSLAFGGPPVAYAPPSFTDWKKGAAQEFRDGIRSEKGIPLLDRHRDNVERAAESVRAALAETFGKGTTEITMAWQSHGVWMRGRLDWMDDNGTVDVDLKTVEDLDPYDWERRNIEPGGLDVQAGMRNLGHAAIDGKERKMIWLLQDIEPPFDFCFVGLAPSKLALAHAKIERAAGIWARCLAANKWPGYGNAVRWAEAKPWEERDFAERAGAVTE